jgi:hypothetical protein
MRPGPPRPASATPPTAGRHHRPRDQAHRHPLDVPADAEGAARQRAVRRGVRRAVRQARLQVRHHGGGRRQRGGAPGGEQAAAVFNAPAPARSDPGPRLETAHAKADRRPTAPPPPLALSCNPRRSTSSARGWTWRSTTTTAAGGWWSARWAGEKGWVLAGARARAGLSRLAARRPPPAGPLLPPPLPCSSDPQPHSHPHPKPPPAQRGAPRARPSGQPRGQRLFGVRDRPKDHPRRRAPAVGRGRASLAHQEPVQGTPLHAAARGVPPLPCAGGRARGALGGGGRFCCWQKGWEGSSNLSLEDRRCGRLPAPSDRLPPIAFLLPHQTPGPAAARVGRQPRRAARQVHDRRAARDAARRGAAIPCRVLRVSEQAGLGPGGVDQGGGPQRGAVGRTACAGLGRRGAPTCARAARRRRPGERPSPSLLPPRAHPDPQDKSLVGADPVVWYTFAFTHFVRPEDYPVMPCDVIGFRWGGGRCDRVQVGAGRGRPRAGEARLRAGRGSCGDGSDGERASCAPCRPH